MADRANLPKNVYDAVEVLLGDTTWSSVQETRFKALTTEILKFAASEKEAGMKEAALRLQPQGFTKAQLEKAYDLGYKSGWETLEAKSQFEETMESGAKLRAELADRTRQDTQTIKEFEAKERDRQKYEAEQKGKVSTVQCNAFREYHGVDRQCLREMGHEGAHRSYSSAGPVSWGAR